MLLRALHLQDLETNSDSLSHASRDSIDSAKQTLKALVVQL